MAEFLARDTFKAGLISEGVVTVPMPISPSDAANKLYVDSIDGGNLLTANQASGTDTLGNTTGFTAANATLLSDTGWAAQGTRSIRNTATSTEAHTSLGGDYVAGTIPVVPGLTYTFQAVVRQAAQTHSLLTRIAWWTSAGNVAASTANATSANTPMTSAGSLHQVVGTAPANAAYCSLMLICSGTSVGTTWNADNLGFWVGSGGIWSMPGTKATDVPAGGAINQVLAKNSATDYDLEWVDGGGGAPEVFVQAAAPGASAVDILWLDIDDTTTEITSTGVRITVAGTEPVGPVDGDLWVDTS